MGKRKKNKKKRRGPRLVLVRQIHPSTGRTVRPLSRYAYGDTPA